MKVNIQYNSTTGAINAVTSGKHLSDEQVEMLAANNVGVLRLELDVNPHVAGKRVNLETLELEDCPVYAEQRRVAEIDRKLADLDAKKQRAIFEGLRHNEWTWYDKHEAEAVKLREERNKK
jgi:S-adenosylmethionine:tRNA-ribosyltransferase-isomerase (queuine synthetase)